MVCTFEGVMSMGFKDYKFLVYSDLYRLTGSLRITTLLYCILLGESFKYNFWMRTCMYTKSSPVLRYSIYPVARILLGR